MGLVEEKRRGEGTGGKAVFVRQGVAIVELSKDRSRGVETAQQNFARKEHGGRSITFNTL